LRQPSAGQGRVSGTFNLTHSEVPPTNRELFDSLAAAQDLGPLTYRGEIEGPTSPVSIDRLVHAGFRPTRTTAANVVIG